MRRKLVHLLLLSVIAIPVQAAAIPWDLVDVAFDSADLGYGGSASGYFVATDRVLVDCGDCVIYEITDWNITVTGNDDFYITPYTYMPALLSKTALA